MNKGRFLILLNLCFGLTSDYIFYIVCNVITFHENVDIAIWHDIQTFVSFSTDWNDGLLLNDILESHCMDYTESKFNAKLKSFIFFSITNGFGENCWCVTE